MKILRAENHAKTLKDKTLCRNIIVKVPCKTLWFKLSCKITWTKNVVYEAKPQMNQKSITMNKRTGLTLDMADQCGTS